jgi:hypothetical protein
LSDGSLQKYCYVGIAVFVLMSLTGWLSGVSISALMIRASLASIFFCVITWGVVSFIAAQFKTDEQLEQDMVPEAEEQPVKGTQLDITLPVEEAVFEAMGQQQINPRLNEIIHEDPERIASMVEKMGLEEKNRPERG